MRRRDGERGRVRASKREDRIQQMWERERETARHTDRMTDRHTHTHTPRHTHTHTEDYNSCCTPQERPAEDHRKQELGKTSRRV